MSFLDMLYMSMVIMKEIQLGEEEIVVEVCAEILDKECDDSLQTSGSGDVQLHCIRISF
jgi:hypothetical protein